MSTDEPTFTGLLCEDARTCPEIANRFELVELMARCQAFLDALRGKGGDHAAE